MTTLVAIFRHCHALYRHVMSTLCISLSPMITQSLLRVRFAVLPYVDICGDLRCTCGHAMCAFGELTRGVVRCLDPLRAIHLSLRAITPNLRASLPSLPDLSPHINFLLPSLSLIISLLHILFHIWPSLISILYLRSPHLWLAVRWPSPLGQQRQT